MKKFYLVIIYGIIVVGFINAQNDVTIIGNWISNENPVQEYRFNNNGNFETFYDGKLSMKGTFIARAGGGRNSREGSLRFNTTHVYGSAIDESFEQRWYSMEELIHFLGITEQNEITEFYREFNIQLWYLIDGNTLTTYNTQQSLYVTITTIFKKK